MEKEIVFSEKCIFEPPKAIKRSEYFCDKRFHVESLIPLYQKEELIGIVFINGKETEYLSYDYISKEVIKLESRETRLKKHNKGGSSSARFGRLHKEAIVHYLKKIVEDIEEIYENFDYLVICGIGERKDEIIHYFSKNLKEKVIDVFSTDKLDDKTFEHIIEVYITQKRKEEYKYLSYFQNEIDKDTNKAVYGYEDTKEHLQNGLLQKLYIVKSEIRGKGNTEGDRNREGEGNREREEEVEKLIEMAKLVNCTYYIISYAHFPHFGPLFGILWF